MYDSHPTRTNTRERNTQRNSILYIYLSGLLFDEHCVVVTITVGTICLSTLDLDEHTMIFIVSYEAFYEDLEE